VHGPASPATIAVRIDNMHRLPDSGGPSTAIAARPPAAAAPRIHVHLRSPAFAKPSAFAKAAADRSAGEARSAVPLSAYAPLAPSTTSAISRMICVRSKSLGV
jgi:hypothetical protein